MWEKYFKWPVFFSWILLVVFWMWADWTDADLPDFMEPGRAGR